MNTLSTSKIAQNASWYTLASVMQKVISFIYFTIIARVIGPEDIGKFVFAVSLTIIISVFLDFGYSSVLIRQIAQRDEKVGNLFGATIWLRTIIAFFAFVFILLLTLLWHKDSTVNAMVIIASLVMILDSYSLALWGVMRGYHNLKLESVSIFITQFLTASVGILGIYLGYGVIVLAFALLCGSLLNTVFALSRVWKYHRQDLSWRPNWGSLTIFFKAALPFALAAVFTKIYSYIDQIMLSVMISDQALGFYSVPYKITFALNFIPAAFAASVYPAMSTYYMVAKEKLSDIFNSSMLILGLIALPISFGTLAIADQLILIVYTDKFISSVLPLQILIMALFPVFLSFPVGALLNARHQQHINTITMGFTMVLNIILNIILIPRFQVVGAATSALVSLIFLFIVNYIIVYKTLLNQKHLFIDFFKILISAILMSLLAWYLKDTLGLLLVILLSIFCYISLLMLMNVINTKKYRAFKELFVTNKDLEIIDV